MQGDKIISSTLLSSILLSYKSIIYKSFNSPLSFRALYKPNKYLFLIMSPSKNTRATGVVMIETITLALASSNSSYVTQTDLVTTTTFMFSKLDSRLYAKRYAFVKTLTTTITDNDAKFDGKYKNGYRP